MGREWKGPLEKVSEYQWKIPQSYKSGMRVPGLVYADDKLMKVIRQDNALEQVANVAFLPGIVKYSLGMPDIHWGYGFSIGGVAATDPAKEGVISPGGVGFDINCGCRLVRTELEARKVKDKVKDLVKRLYSNIPVGVGSSGAVTVTTSEERKLLRYGAKWAVENGYGDPVDIEYIEEKGCMDGADPNVISKKAYERGKNQPGTLGSGNHFLEIQEVDKIYDEKVANKLGIYKGQITVMIHTGSRGFGHQVCSDSLKKMGKAARKYNVSLPDRQLASAPINSPEAKSYIKAMQCAANYAWCNRQCLMHFVRRAFEKCFTQSWRKLGMDLIYDVAHNIAKFETHIVEGEEKKLCVHRKGATRAFPPGSEDLPDRYKKIGQPVIIPGDMGRHSYLLMGAEGSQDTFYSTCHGAGRVMSRNQAVKQAGGRSIAKELANRNIYVMADRNRTLKEESSYAYKDVTDVVNVVEGAGISNKVCRMSPMGVIKG